jgi:Tfp pilus assembly protein PilO
MNTESIKALYKKYPVGIIASAVAIIVLGLLFYRHAALAEMQAQRDQKVLDRDRQFENKTHASLLEAQLQAMESANATIRTRLINPNDLANNLQYFYKLETEAGVKLLNTPRPASENLKASKGLYVPVQYAVSVQGSYRQVLTFLRKLEQGIYYCRVKSAVCSQAQQTNENAPAEVVLSLNVELLGRI